MCLLAVASRLLPGTPLLIGANRDEFFDRPTTPFTVLDVGPPRTLGGRDEFSGGTWLAVNEHGVCAGLTNQPLGEAKDLSRRSRGELPIALARLRSAPQAVDAFLSEFRPTDYNGSWLLVGDRDSLFFIDFTGLVPAEAVPLPPGIHVLENRPLGGPSPKADRVTASIGALADDTDPLDILQRVLAGHDVVEGSGSPASANCVHLEEYGTRSSCIVRLTDDEARPPQIWVADGPPCVTSFIDVSDHWAVTHPVAEGRS